MESEKRRNKSRKNTDVLYRGHNFVVLKDGKVKNKMLHEQEMLLSDGFSPFESLLKKE